MQAASSLIREVCEECGCSVFVERKGKRTCSSCGLEKNVYTPPSSVPGVGDNTHYAPPNALGFGKDLGNPGLNSSRNSVALLQVLSKHNKANLGIRNIQIRSECMRAQESPISQRMLNYGGDFSKKFGFRDRVLFANTLGYNIRWIATILTMMKNGVHSKDFAVATFLLNVRKFFGEKKSVQLMEALWGKEKEGQLFVPDSKRTYILKAKSLIELDKLFL